MFSKLGYFSSTIISSAPCLLIGVVFGFSARLGGNFYFFSGFVSINSRCILESTWLVQVFSAMGEGPTAPSYDYVFEILLSLLPTSIIFISNYNFEFLNNF